jgi:hypothetical protein
MNRIQNILMTLSCVFAFSCKAENVSPAKGKDEDLDLNVTKFVNELSLAVMKKDTTKFEHLKNDPNFKLVILGDFAINAWLCAATSHQIEVVKTFIEIGGSVDIQDAHSGNTPLIEAARKGDVEIINLLLEHNVDCFHVGRVYLTAVDTAINNRHSECAKAMLDYLKVNNQIDAYLEWEHALSKVRTTRFINKETRAKIENEGTEIMKKIEEFIGKGDVKAK